MNFTHRVTRAVSAGFDFHKQWILAAIAVAIMLIGASSHRSGTLEGPCAGTVGCAGQLFS